MKSGVGVFSSRQTAADAVERRLLRVPLALLQAGAEVVRAAAAAGLPQGAEQRRRQVLRPPRLQVRTLALRSQIFKKSSSNIQ